jgi:hypothetical protein
MSCTWWDNPEIRYQKACWLHHEPINTNHSEMLILLIASEVEWTESSWKIMSLETKVCLGNIVKIVSDWRVIDNDRLE